MFKYDNNDFMSGKTRVPDFPEYTEWFNTDRKWKMSDFRGKIVLLDFWTYCCINCVHILPDLKKLEDKYPQLVVIGIHSPKFEQERKNENLKSAIERLKVKHPVINDHKFELWKAYGINAWPSFVFIDPEGKMTGKTSGEGIYEGFDNYISKMIKEYNDKNLINHERIEFGEDIQKDTFLSFPSKIETDIKNDRIFISDSNHNRIVCTNNKGSVLFKMGNGEAGNKDGSFEEAAFDQPQGMAYDKSKDVLYIADTENHLIRKAELKSRQISSIAGTGKQASQYLLKGKGIKLALNSPWDLALDENGHLYIAMAGFHQLWYLNTETLEAKVYAGSGREDISDGGKLHAMLAQPSGICYNSGVLYIADSETSSVRLINKQEVITLAGTGLFDFGDKDGKYPYSKLQHPMGIDIYKGIIYIADTYNNKIKTLEIKNKKIQTICGYSNSGYKDGIASETLFNEPNDVKYFKGKLLIADTNNHLIRQTDLQSGITETLDVKE